MDGIHSLNPSAFHVLVENSHNISIVNSNFDSTTIKPDTHSNAIYVSGSSLVAITNTQIKSGDDCITVSGGSADVSISGITCVAGKGIRYSHLFPFLIQDRPRKSENQILVFFGKVIHVRS